MKSRRKPHRSSARDADPQAIRRRSFGQIDRLLSQAQDIIGRELSSVSLKSEAPRSHRAADKAYDLIDAHATRSRGAEP